MVKESTLGLTVGDMMVSTKWTRNMASEFTLGPMAGGTKDNGSMVNNMEKEATYYRMGLLGMENGHRVRELNGLMKISHRLKINNDIFEFFQ